VKRHVSIIYREAARQQPGGRSRRVCRLPHLRATWVRVTQRRIAVLPTKVGIPQDAGYRVRCQSLGGQPSAQTELPP
jgi:hypothetical protein